MYILNETASEAFACVLCCAVPCSALLCSAFVSEGKSDFRLGIVVTLWHTGSAFGRGEAGGCLQREEVSQAGVDGGESVAQGSREQFSALLNLS